MIKTDEQGNEILVYCSICGCDADFECKDCGEYFCDDCADGIEELCDDCNPAM